MTLLRHILISYCCSFNGQFCKCSKKVVVESPFSPIIMALNSPGFKEKTLYEVLHRPLCGNRSVMIKIIFCFLSQYHCVCFCNYIPFEHCHKLKLLLSSFITETVTYAHAHTCFSTNSRIIICLGINCLARYFLFIISVYQIYS
jgi:hypothetical protein